MIGDEGRKQRRDVRDYLARVDRSNPVVSDTMVDKPPHYNHGSIEAIEYIKQQLGTEFVSYCEGNVHKYLHRWKYKNGVEDLRKAQWYLNCMLENIK